MKSRFVTLSIVGVGFILAACDAPPVPTKNATVASESKGSFWVPDWVVGSWKYNADDGKETKVEIYPDGTALASDGTIGSWFYIDGKAYITWMNGWIDAIVQDGAGFKKNGFAPGHSTDGTPSNTSKAVHASSTPTMPTVEEEEITTP